jgi:hypothetical protein
MENLFRTDCKRSEKVCDGFTRYVLNSGSLSLINNKSVIRLQKNSESLQIEKIRNVPKDSEIEIHLDKCLQQFK